MLCATKEFHSCLCHFDGRAVDLDPVLRVRASAIFRGLCSVPPRMCMCLRLPAVLRVTFIKDQTGVCAHAPAPRSRCVIVKGHALE